MTAGEHERFENSNPRALILIWAPGLMLSAYLSFGPRRSLNQ